MKIKRGLCLQTVADGYVVLPLVAAAESFNGMITLNETGVLLWRTLEKGCTKEELVKVLTEEYEVETETAMLDVERVLSELSERNCIDMQ